MSAIARPRPRARRRPSEGLVSRELCGRWRPATGCLRACGRRRAPSLDQAAALADAAIRCGNGAIGLSARANLHLRGVSERTLPDLHARLEDAGLSTPTPRSSASQYRCKPA